MSGRATFTIVMSSRSMNVPRQTATSVHHLALPAAGPGAAEPGAGEGELVAVRAGPGERVAPWSGSGRWARGSVMVTPGVTGGCVLSEPHGAFAGDTGMKGRS